MKRLVVALLLASTLCMTGCGDTKKTEPAASTTEEVDKASSTMKEQMGDNAVLPSDSVKRVMAKQWKVIGTDTVYDLKEDGTGTKDDAGLTFECGFDEDNNITIKITMDGEEVSLTPTEYEILKFLMSHPKQVFSPRQIYSEVWKDTPIGSEGTVAVHIRHLREKLEIEPSDPRHFKVVWGQGYKFE